jgi:hypothetical protein
MAQITINGKMYQGNSLTIKNNGNTIIIDGDNISIGEDRNITVSVVGDLKSLDIGAGEVTITGNAGSVKAGSGDIEVHGNVTGDVTTGSGDVKCHNVSGNVKTGSGDVYRN